MILKKIVSGGQTGADRAGLDAAIDRGVPHGGFCPRGRRAEDGVIPDQYQLEETRSRDYSVRTTKNVAWSDGTVIFTYGPPTGGSLTTVEAVKFYDKPCLLVNLDATSDSEIITAVASFCVDKKIKTLNVAGSRASKAPGISDRVRLLMCSVVDVLGKTP